MGDDTDAWPAVLLHLVHVFDTLQVSRQVPSPLLGRLQAHWVGLADVIEAQVPGCVAALLGREVHGQLEATAEESQ